MAKGHRKGELALPKVPMAGSVHHHSLVSCSRNSSWAPLWAWCCVLLCWSENFSIARQLRTLELCFPAAGGQVKTSVFLEMSQLDPLT